MRHETPSIISQLDMAAVSMEKANAMLRFELLDRKTQRRLRDVKTLGSPVEIQVLGDGKEVA
ncbi:MAG TPA: hypothetical protein VNH18_12645 [Bryobacteraceae bacterium]|nr:hypothetical protein [Bryobacteraceae bacterium]